MQCDIMETLITLEQTTMTKEQKLERLHNIDDALYEEIGAPSGTLKCETDLNLPVILALCKERKGILNSLFQYTPEELLCIGNVNQKFKEIEKNLAQKICQWDTPARLLLEKEGYVDVIGSIDIVAAENIFDYGSNLEIGTQAMIDVLKAIGDKVFVLDVRYEQGKDKKVLGIGYIIKDETSCPLLHKPFALCKTMKNLLEHTYLSLPDICHLSHYQWNIAIEKYSDIEKL